MNFCSETVVDGCSFNVWLPLCVAIWIGIVKNPDAPSKRWKEDPHWLIRGYIQSDTLLVLIRNTTCTSSRAVCMTKLKVIDEYIHLIKMAM